MSDRNLYAKGLKPACAGRGLKVAARDIVPLSLEENGEAGHSNAADPDVARLMGELEANCEHFTFLGCYDEQ